MTKQISDIEISELIATRISHDIIGNIGAVSNAVELLEEGDLDFLDDIKSILKTSSTVLSSRMKFFRMAFGLNNANLDNLELVEKTIRDYIATIGNSNNTINLEITLHDSSFSKAALLCAMIGADVFVRGGNLIIKQDGGKLLLLADNNSLVPDKVFIIKEVIEGSIQDALAQYAPILYLKSTLRDSNHKITLGDSENLEFIIE